MPATEPSGVVEIRALAADVWVASLAQSGQLALNVTGRTRAEALAELAVLVAAVDARA
jgi:hypothetical protein